MVWVEDLFRIAYQGLSTRPYLVLPPFQIVSHSKNLRESKHF